MSRQVVCFNTVEKVSTLCEFTDSFIDIYVSLLYCHVQCCTLGTRGFSRVRREFSVLAEGRHIFGRRPKPRAAFRAGHYKDLTETGNRARKVSGTQGTSAVVQNRMWGVSTPEIAGGERRGSLGRDVPPRRKMSFISLPCSRQETDKRPHSVTLIHFASHTELSNFLK